MRLPEGCGPSGVLAEWGGGLAHHGKEGIIGRRGAQRQVWARGRAGGDAVAAGWDCVAGVILAGGKSARMGRDKALLRPFGGDGPDMLTRTRRLLSKLVPRCWVACAPGRPYAGHECLFDGTEGRGPVSGVLAALRAAEAEGFAAVLALACDLPFMDVPTLRALLRARDLAPPGTLATFYASAAGGRLEPLTAVYEIAALPLFENAAGGRLGDVIPPQRRHALLYAATSARAFFNMNCAEDAARVRAFSMTAGGRGRAQRNGLVERL